MRRNEWSNNSSCAERPNIFEALTTSGKKKFCASCPVLNECADYGILHEEYEVFGGLSPAERRKARDETDSRYLGLVQAALHDGSLEMHHLVSFDLLSLLQGLNVTAGDRTKSGNMLPGQPLPEVLLDLAILELDEFLTGSQNQAESPADFLQELDRILL